MGRVKINSLHMWNGAGRISRPVGFGYGRPITDNWSGKVNRDTGHTAASRR